VTSGGLGIALAKTCVGGMLGCKIDIKNLPGNLHGGVASAVDAKLFSESQGRILVSISSKNVAKFEKIIKKIPYAKIGKVTKDGKIVIIEGRTKIVDTNIKKLHKIYHSFSNKMQ
jgi:phosphoribosylformylglycinamidine synthase